MVAPNEVVAGRYRLDRIISAGPWGTLFAASDDGAGEPVALIWTGARAGDEAFRREARTAGALSHPAMARTIDQGEHESGFFVVVEEIEASPLSDLLARETRIEPRRAIRICVQILQTLDHAHEAGLTHGGLDPAAVFVTDSDRVKVVGYGLTPRTEPRNDVRAAGRLLDLMLGSKRTPELDGVIAGATEEPQRLRTPVAMRRALEAIRTSIAPEDLEPVEIEEDGENTVWPIPGRRYDAVKLGRRVIASMVAIAIVATAAFLWRVITRANELREQRQESPAPGTPSSTSLDQLAPGAASVTEKGRSAGYADGAPFGRYVEDIDAGYRFTSGATEVLNPILQTQPQESTIERMT